MVSSERGLGRFFWSFSVATGVAVFFAFTAFAQEICLKALFPRPEHIRAPVGWTAELREGWARRQLKRFGPTSSLEEKLETFDQITGSSFLSHWRESDSSLWRQQLRRHFEKFSLDQGIRPEQVRSLVGDLFDFSWGSSGALDWQAGVWGDPMALELTLERQESQRQVTQVLLEALAENGRLKSGGIRNQLEDFWRSRAWRVLVTLTLNLPTLSGAVSVPLYLPHWEPLALSGTPQSLHRLQALYRELQRGIGALCAGMVLLGTPLQIQDAWISAERELQRQGDEQWDLAMQQVREDFKNQQAFSEVGENSLGEQIWAEWLKEWEKNHGRRPTQADPEYGQAHRLIFGD